MRLLIISPHFPPTNAADMQRVRLILPHLAEAGIAAEVLAVEPEQVAAPQDAWLEQGLPPVVPVHRVKALGLEWTKVPGLGVLSFRALRAIRRKGEELLESGQRSEVGGRRSGFDLVYFSTTQFGLHVLGPEWMRKFGVPFVMDYQDPWVNDYYREHPEVVPPGGRLKYGIANWLARRQEPRVVRECAGITSVSAAYPVQIARRYGAMETGSRKSEAGASEAGGRRQETKVRDPESACIRIFGQEIPVLVAPFPGDGREFERVRYSGIRQSVFDPEDGMIHWVYFGVLPPSMLIAIRSFFYAVKEMLHDQPGLQKRLRIHFVGTSYAPAGTAAKIVEPVAADFELIGIVSEQTDRIPYSETLRCLLDADGLVVFGSDDPGYTASKIYPYLLAEKPMLAVFHEQSSVTGLMRKVGGGTVVSFASGETPEAIGRRILEHCFEPSGDLKRVSLDRRAFGPHTAVAQAASLRGFFDECLAGQAHT